MSTHTIHAIVILAGQGGCRDHGRHHKGNAVVQSTQGCATRTEHLSKLHTLYHIHACCQMYLTFLGALGYHVGKLLILGILLFFSEQNSRMHRQAQLCRLLDSAFRHHLGNYTRRHKVFECLQYFWLVKICKFITNWPHMLSHAGSKVYSGVRRAMRQHR